MLYKRTLQPINKTQMSPMAAFFVPESQQVARAVDILARTLWGEARGEGLAGMEAVASVILNRVAMADRFGGKYWWGNDIESVCRKRMQFSCWNETDGNYYKLLAVDKTNREFDVALRIARRAVRGVLIDKTGGATHYHALSVSPLWANDACETCIIGNHVFYKDVG